MDFVFVIYTIIELLPGGALKFVKFLNFTFDFVFLFQQKSVLQIQLFRLYKFK